MSKAVIRLNGLVVYGDGEVIIDTKLWTTQAELAKKLDVSRNTINNRVRRGMARGVVRTYYIEQLGIRLIPNVNKISELSDAWKKQ